MEENNIMVNEFEEENTALATVCEEQEEERDGMSSGAAFALGSLLTLGAIAGVKFGIRKWKEHKENKALFLEFKAKKKKEEETLLKEEPDEEPEEETEEE